VRVEWSSAAVVSARQYMADQAGMREIGAAVAALADDPCPPPPAGFHRGGYHRLRVGDYRIMYFMDGDVITVERVDRHPVQGGLARPRQGWQGHGR
jgi:mRNA-degrading endonuclease RelE of RelBE toxin-antitoxin system